MPLELYIPLIVSPVVLGWTAAYFNAKRDLCGAFGGGHVQTAFDPATDAMIGVDKNGAVKILHNDRIYDRCAQDFRVSERRLTGLWALACALLRLGFSRYDIRLRSQARDVSKETAEFTVLFRSQVSRENFFRAFAPALLEAESSQKKRGKHRREAAALLRIARRNGWRRTRARRVKGFGRVVEELACLFDPAASDFPQAAGGKRGVSAVRKIYVRAIGELYPGYSAETIDTYLRAHFEEVWKSGNPRLRPETKG